MISEILIGPFVLHLYGLFLGLAMAVSWWWAARLLQKSGNDAKGFDVVVTLAVIGGVVGARLYHVVDYWWYYSNHVTEILFLWQGGLGIWGALGGGLVGVLVAKRQAGKHFMSYIDAIVLSLPLGQAIGRLGNWVNSELYGKPTTLPWGWYIPPAFRSPEMKDVAYYHPLFFYESLLSLGLFLVMQLCWQHQWLKKGQALGMYLMGYGLIRFMLEPLRITPWSLGSIPVAQVVSLMAIGVGGWWWRRCRI